MRWGSQVRKVSWKAQEVFQGGGSGYFLCNIHSVEKNFDILYINSSVAQSWKVDIIRRPKLRERFIHNYFINSSCMPTRIVAIEVKKLMRCSKLRGGETKLQT